jgi:hypothetical protein
VWKVPPIRIFAFDTSVVAIPNYDNEIAKIEVLETEVTRLSALVDSLTASQEKNTSEIKRIADKVDDPLGGI